MEALSLTSEIVSELSCSLALTDDCLPDDTHTLLLSALESNVHTHSPPLLPSPPGAGWLRGLQVPPPSLCCQPYPEAALSAPVFTKVPHCGQRNKIQLGLAQRAQGSSCERVNPDTQE